MKTLPEGVVHKLPKDLKIALKNSGSATDTWQQITPLARNEWICWVEDAVREDTRTKRAERVRTELLEGIRRPCCWIGCTHRTDKAISPSVQWVLDRKSKRLS